MYCIHVLFLFHAQQNPTHCFGFCHVSVSLVLSAELAAQGQRTRNKRPMSSSVEAKLDAPHGTIRNELARRMSLLLFLLFFPFTPFTFSFFLYYIILLSLTLPYVLNSYHPYSNSCMRMTCFFSFKTVLYFFRPLIMRLSELMEKNGFSDGLMSAS